MRRQRFVTAMITSNNVQVSSPLITEDKNISLKNISLKNISLKNISLKNISLKNIWHECVWSHAGWNCLLTKYEPRAKPIRQIDVMLHNSQIRDNPQQSKYLEVSLNMIQHVFNQIIIFNTSMRYDVVNTPIQSYSNHPQRSQWIYLVLCNRK